MSDDDLIRRGDAMRSMLAYASFYSAKEGEASIRAIPATDAREKVLREAAAVCDTCPDSHWGPWMKARILALIGEARDG